MKPHIPTLYMDIRIDNLPRGPANSIRARILTLHPQSTISGETERAIRRIGRDFTDVVARQTTAAAVPEFR